MGHKSLRTGEARCGLLGHGKRGVWITVGMGMLAPPKPESPPKDSSRNSGWRLEREISMKKGIQIQRRDNSHGVLGYRHGDGMWLRLFRI